VCSSSAPGVVEAVAGWAIDAIEDGVLVVAELLVNVVMHAHTPFTAVVHLREPPLRVSVSDRRVGVPEASLGQPDGREPQRPAAGRRCRVPLGPAGDETGKTVWAEFAVRPSPR